MNRPPRASSRRNAPCTASCAQRSRACRVWILLGGALLAGGVQAQEDAPEQRLRQLEARLAEQDLHIDALQALVQQQQQALDGLAREVAAARLGDLRARGGLPAPDQRLPAWQAEAPLASGQGGTVAQEDPAGRDAAPDDQVRVGRPPESAARPPEVAQIFDQPGVLTPAGQLVVEGMIQERDVGQRTTLDVLNAQAELTSAREGLISATSSRVIAAFALVAATGRLSPSELGLNVEVKSADGYIATVEDVWQELRAIDE